MGSVAAFTAMVGNVTGSYSYTLTNGLNVTLTGTTSTSPFRQLVTASGAGTQSFTLTVSASGQSGSSVTTLTVNPMPTPGITNLNAAYCKDAPAITLAGSPTDGVFTVDGAEASQFSPASLSVGQHTVGYSYTNASGCSTLTSQNVTIKEVPSAPRIATQGGQSSVSVDVNSGNVNLVASGCNGTLNWSGPNGSSGNSSPIVVATSAPGTFIYTASCTTSGCTSPVASATVIVGIRLQVLHRDVDNYADNNASSPCSCCKTKGADPCPCRP